VGPDSEACIDDIGDGPHIAHVVGKLLHERPRPNLVAVKANPIRIIERGEILRHRAIEHFVLGVAAREKPNHRCTRRTRIAGRVRKNQRVIRPQRRPLARIRRLRCGVGTRAQRTEPC
jgi:hypothetical protein